MDVIIKEKPKIYIHYLPDDITNIIISYMGGPWVYISENINLSPKQIEQYYTFINWEAYSQGINELNYDIIKRYCKKLCWHLILNKWIIVNNITNNEKIPLKYVHFINIARKIIFNDIKCLHIINNNKLYFYSIHFIDCFSDYIDWDWVTKNLKLSTDAIYKYNDFFNNIANINLYKYQNVTNINLLTKLQDKINWELFSIYQQLNVSHYLLFHRKLCWNTIFKKKKLPPSILNRLPMYVIYDNLNIITMTQNLDDEFIINYVKILDPEKILNNNMINNQIKKRIYKNYQSNKYILILNDNAYIDFT